MPQSSMSSLYNNINNIVIFTITDINLRATIITIIISSLFSRITSKLSVHFPVVDTQVRRVPEKPTVLAGHLKHTDTMPFK